MKPFWIAAALGVAAVPSWAQTTIYKHVDENGRVTYTNRPMKGATVLEIDPVIAPPAPVALTVAKPGAKPPVAIVTARSSPPGIPSVDRDTQKGRDEVRRRILEDELREEEATLSKAKGALSEEQRNPMLIAAVRLAQETPEPTPAQQAEMRRNIEKASGRIRGLQATVAEHEKNVEALRKELGALKP